MWLREKEAVESERFSDVVRSKDKVVRNAVKDHELVTESSVLGVPVLLSVPESEVSAENADNVSDADLNSVTVGNIGHEGVRGNKAEWGNTSATLVP